MGKRSLIRYLVFGILAFSTVFADRLYAENVQKTISEERELLPKVWVPDPAQSTRKETSSICWYDPSRVLMPALEIFDTVGSWKLRDRNYPNDIVVRSLSDGDSHLFGAQEFLERVKSIIGSDVSVFVNKKHEKPTFTYLAGVGNVASNAISVHVKIGNYFQFAGIGGTGLLSKRYLNVDGRFFYIGIKGQVGEGEVLSCALKNERLLRDWEREIRRCTWAHRLTEHGGNEDAAANALKQELLAGKATWEASPHRLPMHERMKRTQSLMAERGHNSTNKPSREVANKTLVEAGALGPNREDDSKGSSSLGMWLFLLINGIIVVCIVVFTHRECSLVSDTVRDAGTRADYVNVEYETQGDDAALDGKCWMCETPLGHSSRLPVKMHGEHNKTNLGTQTRHSWMELTIGVPCCMDCIGSILNERSNAWKWRLVLAIVAGTALALITQYLTSEDPSAFFSLLSFVAGACVVVAVSAAGDRFIGGWKLGGFPIVKTLLIRGWKFHKSQKFDTWGEWLMATIGFAVIFFGIQIYTNALHQISRESRYEKTSAYVNTVKKITRNFSTHYSVDYSYVVGGKSFSGKASVDDYNRSSRSIDIFYDKQNPSKSTIEKKTSAGSEMCVMVVLLLIGGFFGLVSMLGIFKTKEAKRRYLIDGSICTDKD